MRGFEWASVKHPAQQRTRRLCASARLDLISRAARYP
jgi:hypothetical protein